MDFLTVPEQELRAIEPHDIEALLLSIGWRQFGGVPGVSRQWVYEENDPTSVVIPVDPTFEDYTLRLREVLTRIASVYPRRPESILLEIELPGSDELTNRKDLPSIGGSIGWAAGESQITGFRKTLIASAKATAVKQRQFGHSQPKIAREFLSRLRMGQTRPGSFIITALSPIGAFAADPKNNQYDDTFAITGRNVVETLTGSLETLLAATNEYLAQDKDEVFDATISGGVSVDLLKGVSENLGTAEGTEIAIDWNPRVPRADGVRTTSVVFEAKHRPALIAAQKRLQKLSKGQPVKILGRVTNLDRKDPKSPGVITVDVIDGAEPSTVKIRLESEYNETGASHFPGDLIRIDGILGQDRTQYWITGVTGLSLLDSRGNTKTIIGSPTASPTAIPPHPELTGDNDVPQATKTPQNSTEEA
jgi:hypothetical protein